MLGRTPSEAYFELIEPIQRALNFIAVGRLLLGRVDGGLSVGKALDALLNGGDPAPVAWSRSEKLFIRAGYQCRIDQTERDRALFSCQLIAYYYAFLNSHFDKIVAFHWRPAAVGPERAFPHLHVGRTVSGGGSVIPERFHKLHIPTGFVPAESVVRFAIEELDVKVRPGLDRDSIVRRLESPVRR